MAPKRRKVVASAILCCIVDSVLYAQVAVDQSLDCVTLTLVRWDCKLTNQGEDLDHHRVVQWGFPPL